MDSPFKDIKVPVSGTATIDVNDTSIGLGGIITGILPYIFGIAGIILLLNIITSGFKMMTSTGDPKVMQAAQAKLTTSVIGISILFVSFWIVMLIMKFLGIETILFN